MRTRGFAADGLPLVDHQEARLVDLEAAGLRLGFQPTAQAILAHDSDAQALGLVRNLLADGGIGAEAEKETLAGSELAAIRNYLGGTFQQECSVGECGIPVGPLGRLNEDPRRPGGLDPSSLAGRLAGLDLPALSVEPVQASLEDVFLDVVEKAARG